jgi:hypothetical protein
MNNRQKEYLQRYQKEFVALFPGLSSFADQYFVKHFNEFKNAVDYWDDEPFPEGYTPFNIEIYYCKSHSPHIYIVEGILQNYDLPKMEENNPSITLFIDSNLAYIQIEGKEILNKIGGAILPETIMNPSTTLNNIINGGIS